MSEVDVNRTLFLVTFYAKQCAAAVSQATNTEDRSSVQGSTAGNNPSSVYKGLLFPSYIHYRLVCVCKR